MKNQKRLGPAATATCSQYPFKYYSISAGLQVASSTFVTDFAKRKNKNLKREKLKSLVRAVEETMHLYFLPLEFRCIS